MLHVGVCLGVLSAANARLAASGTRHPDDLCSAQISRISNGLLDCQVRANVCRRTANLAARDKEQMNPEL